MAIDQSVLGTFTPSPVPFVLTEPTRIPAERYYDAGFAALEDERLWSRTWQMACRLEEIPSPGDYTEYEIGDQSLIVVRVDDTTIRAYHNACRHRATELIVGSGSFRGGRIVCPFHGWRWNLDGTSAGVFSPQGFEPELIAPGELCLPQAAVGTWGGCVWVNLDLDAPPLLEALEPIASMLDPLAVDRMKVVWWKSTVLKANWKLAMEAFIEGYHIMQTHPQLTMGRSEGYDPGDLAYAVHPNGHSSYNNRSGAQATHRRSVDLEEIEALIESSRLLGEGLEAMTLPRDLHVIESLRGREIPERASLGSMLVKAIYEYSAQARIPLPKLDAAGLSRWGGVYVLFPNSFILPQYGNALTYRFRPVHGEPEQCLLELWSISIPAEGQDVPRPVLQGPFAADDSEHWPPIPLQDFSNIERQQRGLRNRTVTATRLSSVYEIGISHLHQEVDRYLARPVGQPA